MIKWLIRLAWVLVALIVGAWQENWKIDINYILDLHVHVANYEALPVDERAAALKSNHAYMPYDYYFNHANNRWILALSIAQLKKLKWILTVFFVLLFFFLNRSILQTFSETKPILRHFAWGYAIAFVLSFGIYAAGRLVGLGDITYAVAREVVGGLQSLIPTMFVLPLVLFQRKLHETP
jgi:hypothetical protein